MVDARDVKAIPENAGLLALTDKLQRQLEHQQAEGSRLADDEFAADGVRFELIAATDGIAVEFEPGIDMAREKEIRTAISKILSIGGKAWKLTTEAFPIAGYRGVVALPPHGGTPPIGEAWELARKIGTVADVRSVTPLFAQLVPVVAETKQAMDFFTAAVLTPESRRRWHLRELRVPAAWQKLREKRIEPGAGVVVAVADTGYTNHPEIFERFTKDPYAAGSIRGEDLLDGADPRDPLQGGGWFFP
jgi:hypothetical protein